MLTITTADPNNTPTDAAPHQLDPIYQAMFDDDIDLYNPHLNVRDAYIRHVEQQNAGLKTQINDLQDLLSQADRVILALLASLLVFAVIAVAMVWR